MHSGQVSQAFDGVMAAKQLAWHKHLHSQPLTLTHPISPGYCEDASRKILGSYTDSFAPGRREGQTPHLGRAGLNLPKWIVACVNVWKVTDLNQIT